MGWNTPSGHEAKRHIIIAKASQSIIIYDIYSGDKISEFSYPKNNNDSLYGVTYHKHLDAIIGWSSHNIYMQPLHSKTSIDTACIVPRTQILTGTKLDPATTLLRTLPYDEWSKLQSKYSACLN